MKTLISKFLTVALLVGSFASQAGDQRPTHEVHSMMIYNFIKYIQWPDYDSSQDFVIGVMGDDDVFNTLTTWYHGKVRGDKKFVVKKYDSPADIANSHIIYVGKSSAKDFDVIKGKVANTSTLTITDKPGLGAKGSVINFKTVNNKLAFELNQKAVEQSKLKVSGQLSAMAILI